MPEEDRLPVTSSPQFPLESEVALIIRSKKPQVIARQIAGLSSIAKCQLLPRGSEEIHDVYFDTLDDAFQPQKLALRIREGGNETLITLKGPSRQEDGGGVERIEIEGPWSKDMLATIVEQLADWGIEMRPPDQEFDLKDPRDDLINQGLKVVQDRRTHRQARDVVRAGEEDGPKLAELAIDSVVYHFDNHKIRHYEVEIEAKTEEGLRPLKPLIDGLIKMFGGETLRKTEHSKLAVGFALQALLVEGALEGLIDLDGNLKPAAYDKIDEYLRRSTS
jgi:hypothetical protein